MRLRSAHRNSVTLARLQVRRPRTTANVSRARRAQAAIHSLRPTQTKFNYGIVLSGEADTRRFRRYQALKIQNGKQSRFEELAFDDRAAKPHQRLVGEDQCSLWHCIDVAG